MWPCMLLFARTCVLYVRGLEPCCACVCPWRQHGPPTLPCKPICTEYSGAGSGRLHLIVCWVIYSEPGIESDVYCHCTSQSSSMGTHAPLHLLLLLFTHISHREQLLLNILTPWTPWGLRHAMSGGSRTQRGEQRGTWDMIEELKKSRLGSLVRYSTVSFFSLSMLSLYYSFSLNNIFFSLLSSKTQTE